MATAFAVIGISALAIAACGGSSSTSTSGGGGSSSSSDGTSSSGSSSTSSGGGGGGGGNSPEAAVRGFVSAFSSSKIVDACNWAPPSQQSSCQAAFQQLAAVGGQISFRIDNFDVTSTEIDKTNPNKAKVHVRGNAVICSSLGSLGSATTPTCQPTVISPDKESDAVPCVRENGKWYVDFGASSSETTTSSTT
jgi:hypothetical protein